MGREGPRFFERTRFFVMNENVREKGVVEWWTNKTDCTEKRTNFLKDFEKKGFVFFTELTIFSNNFLKKLSFFSERTIDRTILLNKWFHWTFIQWENDIDGEWKIILRTTYINFFEQLKKNKKMNCLQTMNDQIIIVMRSLILMLTL